MDTKTRLPEGYCFWGRLDPTYNSRALPVPKLHVVQPSGSTMCGAYKIKDNQDGGGLCTRYNPNSKDTFWSMAFAILAGRDVLGVTITRRTQHLVDEFCAACSARLKEQ